MHRTFVLLCGLLTFLYHLTNGQVVITGAGTAPALLVHNMLLAFYATEGTTTINYVEDAYPTPRDKFLNGTVDFFVSTQYLPQDEHTIGECCQCDDIRAVPIIVSGWSFIHNLGGSFGQSPVQLNLTREQIVRIYLGTIKNWADINSTYPNAPINVAYQECASGTDTITAAFAAMSPEWPASNVCPHATFPVGTGFTQHADVLQYVMNTPNSIGYMSYATYKFEVKEPTFTRQSVGIINKAGKPVLPNTESFYAASVAFAPTAKESSLGVVENIVDAPGAASWPFSNYEYITVRSRSNDCSKLGKLYRFIVWIMSAREVLSVQLAPFGISVLPPDTNRIVLAMLNNFVCCTRHTISAVNTEGTIVGHSTFVGLSSSRIYGYTPLNDVVTASKAALDAVSSGAVDAALSTVYPVGYSSDVLPIRLFGAAVVCAANLGLGSDASFVLDNVTLASIFGKSITTWDHADIRALNPNYQAQLTGPISLVDFSDVDTRTIFSNALSLFSPSFSSNNLPAAKNLASSQSVLDNIAAAVGSIGCFEYSTSHVAASSVTFVSLKNAAGNVIAAPPNWESIMSAMNDFASTPEILIVNGRGPNTWPICAYNYLVLNVNVKAGRCVQMSALAQLAVWIFTTSDAQAIITGDGLSYPPASVRSYEQNKFVNIVCNGVSLSPYVEDIYGVGASFPLLVYQSWPLFFSTMPDPATLNPSVTVQVSYAISGSSGAEEYYNSNLGEVFAGKSLAHFGATDISLPVGASSGLSKFPTLAGGLALVMNLGPSFPNSAQVVLSREAIVQIYSGVIKRWNDQRIVALNPSIPASSFPNRTIILVYRNHESGSTYILKKALQSFSSAAAPWNTEVNSANEWPYTSGALYASNSYFVTTIVDSIPLTFGYVEHSYALFTNLRTAAILNKAGTATLPTQDTITSAMNDFPLSANNLVKDLVDGPGSNSYPLASYTYVLVNKSWTDCATSTRVLTFLDWSIKAEGPRLRAKSFDFVPLPNASILLVEEELRTFKCAAGDPALPSIARGCDGNIGSGKKNDSCGICGGNNSTCCLGTEEQIQLYCFQCDYFHDRPPFLLNSYKCDGFLDCTGAEDDLDCDVSIVKTSIVLTVLAGLCIIGCFAVGVDLFYNRNERIFRESNVFFMMMILSGVIIGYASVFVLSQLTKLNNFVCGVQYWFFCVAFVLTFGSMIAKTYQVYMLHRQHSGDLSAYTNQAIVRYVAAALLVAIVILIIWTAADRPKPVLRHNDPGDDLKEHLICGNKHFTVFALLLALFFGIILVSGVVLSFLSRAIDFEGNESRLIRRTILSAALLAVVILPILIALGSSFPFVRILLSNVALLLLATLIMVTYFGPKLYAFHFGSEGSYTELKGGMKRLAGPIDI